jgi:hypothetical protein
MPGRLLFDTMNLKAGPQARQLHAQRGRQALHRRSKDDISPGDIFRLHAATTTTTGRWWRNIGTRLRSLQPALREAVRRDGRVRHGRDLPGAHDLIFLRGQGAKALSSCPSPAGQDVATRSPVPGVQREVPRGARAGLRRASTWMIRRRVGLPRCTLQYDFGQSHTTRCCHW